MGFQKDLVLKQDFIFADSLYHTTAWDVNSPTFWTLLKKSWTVSPKIKRKIKPDPQRGLYLENTL